MFAQYMRIDGKQRLMRNWISVIVGWIPCTIVMLVVMKFFMDADEVSILPFGTLITLTIFVIRVAFPRGTFLDAYDMAVGMNRTRKSFMSSYMGVELICNVGTMLMVMILYHVECGLYRIVVKCDEYAINMDGLFHPAVLAGIILLATSVALFMPALYTIHPALPYTIWILLCFGPTIVTNSRWKGTFVQIAQNSVVQFVTHFSLTVIGMLMAVVAVVLFAVAWKILSVHDIHA